MVPALGRLEPYDGIILISAVPGDQVQAILVPEKVGDKENWSVTKGQELVVLKSKLMRDKEKSIAEAQLDAATKQVNSIEKSGKAQLFEAQLKRDGLLADAKGDIKSLELKVGLLKKQYKSTKDSYTRMKELTAGTVPQEEITKQGLAAESARVELKSSENLLERAKEGLTRTEKEANARIDSLQASLERAVAEVPIKTATLNKEVAELRYETSLVLSPIEGEVLAILAHVGDTTGPTPLMRVGNLKTLAVIAEVDEGNSLYVRKGQTAEVKSPALRSDSELKLEKIKGTVMEVGKTITRNNLTDINPGSFSNRRVVEVKIELKLSELKPDQLQALKRLIGHEFSVDILIDKQAR